MFKILDGRDKFYQWDLDRKLIVADKSIKEVHFCNRYGNTSIIRATYEVEGLTIVNVPNIILQESFALHIYAFDVNYTKHEDVIEIVPRTKPENYINTEEELRIWDELEQKVIDLENKMDAEGIRAAVTQYLTDNPPEAGATREEAAQIQQNKADIEDLQREVAAIEIPDVSNFATTGYVDEKIADIDFPEGADLSGYATKKYVDEAIQNIDIPEVEVDLGDYYTKTEVDSKLYAVDKSYFLDFSNATGDWKEASALIEMTYLGNDLVNNNSVCANIKEASTVDNSNTYYPAIIKKVDDKTFSFVRAGIDVSALNSKSNFGVYQIKDFGNSQWYYKRVSSDDYEIVTTDNVNSIISSTVDHKISASLNTTLKNYDTSEVVDTKIEEAINSIPTGGSGEGGVPEVSIGTSEPTDGSILWINPEENGGFLIKDDLVNGGTMEENADGTLSTVIGGSKELSMVGGVLIKTIDGTPAWTNANPNRSYFQTTLGTYTERTELSLSNVVPYGKFMPEYEYAIEYKVHYGGFITDYHYDLQYVSNTQANFIGTDEIFEGVEWHSSYGLVLNIKIDTAVFNAEYKISELNFILKDVYDKTPFDANYIPVGNGLVVSSGLLTTKAAFDNSVLGENAIVQNENELVHRDNSNGRVALGYQNWLGGTQGVCVLGRFNRVEYNASGGNIAIGSENRINNGNDNVLFGYGNEVTGGGYIVLGGYQNKASLEHSYGFGEGLQFDYSLLQTRIGHYNANNSKYYSFAIGNGTDDSDRRDAMTIDGNNNASFAGTVTSQGADYAEYFEWADGNPEAEDRVGYIVALVGDKIVKANAGDEVLGIISGTVAILGDNYEWHWNGKYVTDDFGRIIYDMVDKYSESTEEDPEPRFLGTYPMPRINPEWDETREYVNRANRAEWDTVGMFGKLYVRDDGSCVTGSYATVGADGVATSATGKTNMYVMERTNENIVKVLLK